MNIVVEQQPKCIATLRVEIPADKVTSERNQILRTYTAEARIPGFRPGKAPRAVVEKRFEKNIAEKLQSKLLSEAYQEAIRQESLKLLDYGVPENLTTHPDGSMSFDATLTLAPVVQLPAYKGITVTVPPLALPDEDFAQQLEAARERFAEFIAIEGRGAELGDFAVIDYSSTVNGQPTDEFLGKSAGYLSGREGFWVRLDEQVFLPGFARQVIGMHPGESRDISVTLPEDFPVAGLRNAELLFNTTLKDLKQSVLPALDDALATRLAPGKSMEELKTIMRVNLQHERQRKIDDLKVNQIVAYFDALADFELPAELINQETQNQADAMVERGINAGMTEEEVQAQQGDIFATAAQQAVSHLRANFIFQEIASVENITVEDQELANHLARIAVSRNVAPKKFINDMKQAGRLTHIRQSMLIGKVVDFLVEHAEVLDSTTTLND
ncbi:MAG: trigger factor [Verrucomicrobia bacterium]|nr:trigger factor [Verrucomicrobiota bacterium]